MIETLLLLCQAPYNISPFSPLNRNSFRIHFANQNFYS